MDQVVLGVSHLADGGRGESMTILEELATHQLFAKTGNVANPATDWRVLTLQERVLRDEAKGDSHSEARQQEESSILLGTWHQGECQQEEKGFSGCGSERSQFCLSTATLEFRNHQEDQETHQRQPGQRERAPIPWPGSPGTGPGLLGD